MVDVPAGILGSLAIAGLAAAGAAAWRRRSHDARATASATTLAFAEEAAAAGVWSEDLRTGAVNWSSGTFRILGLDPTRDQVRSLDRLEYLLSGHREAIARAMAALRTGETNRAVEVQLRRPDGALRDLSLSMRTMTDKAGRPIEIAGVLVDVTRLRAAERGLADRDEQVQRAVSASRSAIWDWDLQSGDFYVSSRLAEMVNLPREPWVPSRALHDSLCHPDDRERVGEALRLHAEKGEPFEIEYRLRAEDGPDVWVQTRGRAVSFRDGKPTRSIGSIIDVTQRREMDAVIAEKQQMLELAVEAAEAGYFEERFDTGEVTWSPRLRRILGVAPDQPARSGYIQERVYPEDLPDFLVGVEEWRRTLKPLDIEFRVRHTAGHYIWLHVRAVHQRDSGGRRLRGVGFVLEVSDRLEAQRALADSERKFRNLVDGSIQGVVIHRRHKPLFCNPAYARLLGYDSVDEVLALPSLTPHLSPGNTEESDTFWERAVTGELDGRVFRRRIVRKNSTEAWFEAVGRVIQWEGEPAWQMAVIEITDQMRIENELRSSEERFRFLADNATDILTLYDQDGLMLYVSPSVQRIAGYTVEESIGRSPFAIVHPEDVEALRVRRGLTGHVPQGGNARWRLRHRDGHWMWMESRASVIPMPGGGHHVLTASRDISESVQREAEMQAARDRLQQQADELVLLAQNLEIERSRAEQANLAKSQFLAMMSHELRTPLTGVLGMADLLLLSNQTEEQERVTKLLARSARVLLDLLNDVLDFSKIEAGQLTVERIPFSVASVLTEVSELYASMLDDKGLRLEIEIAPQVTDAVIGDPKRLRQVLSNLVSNSAKFTHKGRIKINVEMELRGGSELRLEFAVSDTGIGISAADAAKLFRPFVQADLSTSRQYGGSGLGLAICKRLVNAMGGEISLDSALGRGSTFRFDIVVEAAGSLLQSEESHEAEAAGAPTRTLHILMAEDNDTTRYLLSAMLERLGHRIVAVADGRQAVDACINTNFDIILMDMQMPVMDGADAARLIRQLPGPVSKVPIVALTADAIPEHRAGFLEAGANAVVVKPVVWRDLGEVIDLLVPGAGIAQRVARGLAKAESDRAKRPAATDRDAEGPPAIDHAVLDDLTSALGEAAVASMMPTFVANMVEYRDQLASAISANDFTAAKRAAHAMKGLAAQFGAPQVSALARSIEQECLTISDVAQVLGKLVSAVAVAAQAIKSRDQALGKPAPVGGEN